MYVCMYEGSRSLQGRFPTPPIFLLLWYRTEFEAPHARTFDEVGTLGQGIVVVKVVAIMLVMTVMILEIPTIGISPMRCSHL